MAQRNELLRQWLATARERLTFEDYAEYKSQLQALYESKPLRKDEEQSRKLHSLAGVLLRAVFPEGHQKQEEWMGHFTICLPPPLATEWQDVVHNALLPTSLPPGQPSPEPSVSSEGPQLAQENRDKAEALPEIAALGEEAPGLHPALALELHDDGQSSGQLSLPPGQPVPATPAPNEEMEGAPPEFQRGIATSTSVCPGGAAAPPESRWLLKRSEDFLAAREEAERRAGAQRWPPPARKRPRPEDNGPVIDLESTAALQGHTVSSEPPCQHPAEAKPVAGNEQAGQEFYSPIEASASAPSSSVLPLCCMCRQYPRKPRVAALCGHFACGECWRQWLMQRLECPMCRKKVRPNNLITLNGWTD